MILGKRSKVKIRGIKGEFEEREGGLFWHFEILRKEERKKPERKKERKRGDSKNPSQNQHHFDQGREILHF